MQQSKAGRSLKHRKWPPRRRGYRIHISRVSGPSVDLPLIWSAQTPTEAWERVKQDRSVVRAVLYRSGRPFQEFRRS